ncbi:hypothetical protein [Pseudonocardia sp. T1-2H]|uniref:hypothetical protein n=1 Tax=Pseudonocardia sp. T1-2H TaxID=3128899 RepID=UPI00310123C1
MPDAPPPHSPDSTSSGGHTASSDKAADRRHTLLIAVLTGVIGIGGALSGSLIQTRSAADAQAAQIAEEREKESRATQADVYFKFLDAADRYGTTTAQVQACLNAARDGRPDGQEGFTVDGECGRHVADLAPARYDFQETFNKVSVYGSPEAYVKAVAIAAYLPRAVSGDVNSGLPPLDARLNSYDRAEFTRRYADFLTVACRDLPAAPRPNCET